MLDEAVIGAQCNHHRSDVGVVAVCDGLSQRRLRCSGDRRRLDPRTLSLGGRLGLHPIWTQLYLHIPGQRLTSGAAPAAETLQKPPETALPPHHWSAVTDTARCLCVTGASHGSVQHTDIGACLVFSM